MSMSTTTTTTSSSSDTIERILSLCPRVHVYTIPPLTSNKGHTAATWTADPARQIFTARLRVLESATPIVPADPDSSTDNNNNNNNAISKTKTIAADSGEHITVTVLLEDPATGELFAAAPYTHPSTVQPAQDSSRFFAVRVVGGGGSQTAMLGIGFEDRADAVDFGICLQEARKVLGFEDRGDGGGGGGGRWGQGEKGKVKKTQEDWRLKEGETIKIDVGGRGASGRRRRMNSPENGGAAGSGIGSGSTEGDAKAALFSIKPPPPPPSSSASSAIPLLAPPPGANAVRAERRRSREIVAMMGKPPNIEPKAEAKIETAGFDDGEFGEFQ